MRTTLPEQLLSRKLIHFSKPGPPNIVDIEATDKSLSSARRWLLPGRSNSSFFTQRVHKMLGVDSSLFLFLLYSQ